MNERTILSLVSGPISAPKAGGKARARIIGFAAWTLSAMAFVDPKLAAECQDTVEKLRSAALNAEFGSEELRRIEFSASLALNSQAAGDEPGALQRVAEIRAVLGRA